MALYESRQELADKADYEGGVADMLYGYGLCPEDVPAADTELREAITEALKAKPWIDKIYALLPEPGEDD